MTIHTRGDTGAEELKNEELHAIRYQFSMLRDTKTPHTIMHISSVLLQSKSCCTVLSKHDQKYPVGHNVGVYYYKIIIAVLGGGQMQDK